MQTNVSTCTSYEVGTPSLHQFLSELGSMKESRPIPKTSSSGLERMRLPISAVRARLAASGVRFVAFVATIA